MAKSFIGKRVTVQIGGIPHKEDDTNTIIGQDTTVYVPENEVHKYNKIVGEEILLTIGGEIDETINDIIKTMQQSTEPNKDQIIRISKEILNESDGQTKQMKVNTLISIASGITTIANSIIDLKIKLGI